MKERIPQILHWGCRIILAAMFFYTGYVKIESTLQFAVTLLGYELFPETLVFFIAKWFPWVEIALGVFLLMRPDFNIRWKIRYVAAATTALMLFFTVILTITYFRGIDANCGCFDFDSKISPLTILRDSIILIPALYLLFEHRLFPSLKPVKPEDSGNIVNLPDDFESDVS